jgi:hypothetical protein
MALVSTPVLCGLHVTGNPCVSQEAVFTGTSFKEHRSPHSETLEALSVGAPHCPFLSRRSYGNSVSPLQKAQVLLLCPLHGRGE